MAEVLKKGPPAYIHLWARADKHVTGGNDVSQRRDTRILARDPDRYWDVVGGASKGYRKQAVEAEQELRAAIIVCCGSCRWG